MNSSSMSCRFSRLQWQVWTWMIRVETLLASSSAPFKFRSLLEKKAQGLWRSNDRTAITTNSYSTCCERSWWKYPTNRSTICKNFFATRTLAICSWHSCATGTTSWWTAAQVTCYEMSSSNCCTKSAVLRCSVPLKNAIAWLTFFRKRTSRSRVSRALFAKVTGYDFDTFITPLRVQFECLRKNSSTDLSQLSRGDLDIFVFNE